MNKKNLYYIIGGIVLVVLISFVVLLQNQQPSKLLTAPTGPTGKTETPGKTLQEIDQATMQEAMSKQDVSLCENMQIEANKEACKINVIVTEASFKKDSSVCDQIQNEISRSGCKDNVIIIKARDNKNPALCQNLVDKTRIQQCQTLAAPQ